VIYSLANFLASQGAFQAEFFSATSVVFYIGVVRQADGQTRVSGYRYLPTIHVDNDTRPAPIPPDGYSDAINHVRLEMRDFAGVFQVGSEAAALGGRVEICPVYSLPSAPDQRIAGDFAQYFATLGSGTTLHPAAEALAVLGAPLGPVTQELSGDCRTTTNVLYTEHQRLELHPELAWPFRVSGTQLGAAIYQQKYRVNEVPRRLNLAGGAIANERFKAFFQAYGGLPVFGYPISGMLAEPDASAGQPKMVQYFERARFELVPGAAAPDLLHQVQLGALSREYAGIADQCTLAAPLAGAPAAKPQPASETTRPLPSRSTLAPTQAAPAAGWSGSYWIGWALVVLGGTLLAGLFLPLGSSRRTRTRGVRVAAQTTTHREP
jgi:hypothetical protein